MNKYNSSNIWAINQKRDPKHMLLGDKPGTITQFSKWRFTDIKDVKKNPQAILRYFALDFHNEDIKVVHRLGAGALASVKIEVPNPNWADIHTAIKEEQDEFWDDILYLESKFVKYGNFRPLNWIFWPFGIKKNLRDMFHNQIIAGQAIDIDSPGSWSDAQELAIDQAIVKGQLGRNKAWQTILMPNYSTAVQTWWKLFKQWRRLKTLDELLNTHIVGAGHGHLFPRDYQQVIVNINQQR